MASRTAWAGWIGFAALLMMVIGALDFFQGMIAVIRDEYYLLGPERIIVVDLTTWGWLMMIWGIVLFLVGSSLMAGQGWARWFSIVLISLNFIGQLGFAGGVEHPLWALTVLALNIVVLYALTVRWEGMREPTAY